MARRFWGQEVAYRLKLLAELAKQRFVWFKDKGGVGKWEGTSQTVLPVGSQ